MATSLILASVLVVSDVATTALPSQQVEQERLTEHQVVAIYFHRTQRCPTCKRIGAMAEQAVSKGFEKELATRTVRFRFVEFQDIRNAKLAKTYSIESPTLLLLNAFDGETLCWTAMPKIWQLAGKPSEFRTFVHDGVARYLMQGKEDAEQERETSKESKE